MALLRESQNANCGHIKWLLTLEDLFPAKGLSAALQVKVLLHLRQSLGWQAVRAFTYWPASAGSSSFGTDPGGLPSLATLSRTARFPLRTRAARNSVSNWAAPPSGRSTSDLIRAQTRFEMHSLRVKTTQSCFQLPGICGSNKIANGLALRACSTIAKTSKIVQGRELTQIPA